MKKTILIFSMLVVFGLTSNVQAVQSSNQSSQYEGAYNASVSFVEKHPTLVNMVLKYVSVSYSHVYKRMDAYFLTEGYTISTEQVAQNNETLLGFMTGNKDLTIKVIDRVKRHHPDAYKMMAKIISGAMPKIDLSSLKVLNRIK